MRLICIIISAFFFVVQVEPASVFKRQVAEPAPKDDTNAAPAISAAQTVNVVTNNSTVSKVFCPPGDEPSPFPEPQISGNVTSIKISAAPDQDTGSSSISAGASKKIVAVQMAVTTSSTEERATTAESAMPDESVSNTSTKSTVLVEPVDSSKPDTSITGADDSGSTASEATPKTPDATESSTPNPQQAGSSVSSPKPAIVGGGAKVVLVATKDSKDVQSSDSAGSTKKVSSPVTSKPAAGAKAILTAPVTKPKADINIITGSAGVKKVVLVTEKGSATGSGSKNAGSATRGSAKVQPVQAASKVSASIETTKAGLDSGPGDNEATETISPKTAEKITPSSKSASTTAAPEDSSKETPDDATDSADTATAAPAEEVKTKAPANEVATTKSPVSAAMGRSDQPPASKKTTTTPASTPAPAKKLAAPIPSAELSKEAKAKISVAVSYPNADYESERKAPPQNPDLMATLAALKTFKGSVTTDFAELLASATPGKDYPNLTEIPEPTSFSCGGVNQAGFYADIDSDCQVIRRCDINGNLSSYLCPIQTRFNQITLVCDWFWNIDCSQAKALYDYSNNRLYHAKWVLLDTVPDQNQDSVQVKTINEAAISEPVVKSISKTLVVKNVA